MNDPFAADLLARLPFTVGNVALLRPSRIGDFICASPALRALHMALPSAAITMITLPLLSELAERSPYLDRVVPFPGYPGLAEQFFEPRRTAEFFVAMQRERFDLAIQMQGSGVYSNPFTLMLGARVTAGFVRPGDGPGRLDAALPFPADEHEVRRVLALTTFLGAPPRGDGLNLQLRADDHAAAARLLNGAAAPLIGLHTGARDRTRRWPTERFAATALSLRRRFGGTIVVVGDSHEEEAAGLIERQAGDGTVNLAGRSGLAVLGAVIARLAVLVTNDSGPAHMAYALRTPAVVIFGGGSPRLNGPLDGGPHRILEHPVPCRPCGYTSCPIGYPCLHGLSVERVVGAVEEIIRASDGTARASGSWRGESNVHPWH